MKMSPTNLAFTIALGALASGCGGGALPNETLTSAKEAVSAAEAVGAKDEPKAALHLQLAEDGIVDAEKYIADNEMNEARLLLERAIADAKLARDLTDEAEKRRSAELAITRLEGLEQSTNAQGN